MWGEISRRKKKWRQLGEDRTERDDAETGERPGQKLARTDGPRVVRGDGWEALMQRM